METPEVYPDVLGDALSFSSQRLAQLGSLVTGGATVVARRRAEAAAARAVRDDRALRALREQERAALRAARAGWAPAHDARWLAQADLLQAVRVWSAAAAYADADPVAASAVRKCEERLRVLHPYAMGWYDRLRGEGMEALEAMRQAVPMFGRAPHARPGDPGAERRGLTGPGGSGNAAREGDADGVRQAGAEFRVDRDASERGEPVAAPGWEGVAVDAVRGDGTGDRTPAELAAESFPYSCAHAVRAGATAGAAASPSPARRVAVQNGTRPGRSG
jgi:hypothetical protein